MYYFSRGKMSLYQTLEQEKYDLETLTDGEQLLFDLMYEDHKQNPSRSRFQDEWGRRAWKLAEEYQVTNHGKTNNAPIYKIYDDLADRVGIKYNDPLAPKVQGVPPDPIISD